MVAVGFISGGEIVISIKEQEKKIIIINLYILELSFYRLDKFNSYFFTFLI